MPFLLTSRAKRYAAIHLDGTLVRTTSFSESVTYFPCSSLPVCHLCFCRADCSAGNLLQLVLLTNCTFKWDIASRVNSLIGSTNLENNSFVYFPGRRGMARSVFFSTILLCVLIFVYNIAKLILSSSKCACVCHTLWNILGRMFLIIAYEIIK